MREDLMAAARRGIVSTADAERRGATGRDLRRAAEAAVLVRVRRDAYVASETWHAGGDAARHLVRVHAVAVTNPGVIVSHESAAAVWGLPLLGPWPSDVQLLGTYRGGGRAFVGAVHRSTTGDLVPVLRTGIRVTSCARTVVDVARTRSFACGLVAADHALRVGAVSLVELQREVAALGRRRGVRGARHVLAHASALAESPGESLSRARMVEHGLSLPRLQVEHHDARGLIGRVDFWWPGVALVGEFDGRVKYLRDAERGDPRTPEDRLWAEKVREDRLRASGARVVRWTWADAWDTDRLAAILRTAGVPPA